MSASLLWLVTALYGGVALLLIFVESKLWLGLSFAAYAAANVFMIFHIKS